MASHPSVVLNNPSVGPPVALAGRVKVKVKRTNDMIQSGDFLTTSDEPGVATIATEPGPVIGYAVENQVDGQEFVEILVQPGRFFYPSKQINLRERRVRPDVNGESRSRGRF